MDTVRGWQTTARLLMKRALAPLLFRNRPIGLLPARLYLYLEALNRTSGIPGAVVEIGCAAGGTAALAAKMLRDMGDRRDYLCIDTFSGFVKEQFAEDVAMGNKITTSEEFSANDMDLVRKVLRMHSAEHVRLLQGDIVSLSPNALPDRISVCLIDVDLYVPVLEALKKVYPRMSIGGEILVDDCPEGYDWQARKGYSEFVAGKGIAPKVMHGMGMLERH